MRVSPLNITWLTLGFLCACRPQPTYHADVQPILANNCLGCHGPDGVAHPDLSTFESVAANAQLIKDVTTSRRMPPYLVDATGSCGSYVPSGYLSQEQIRTIDHWAEGGATKGDVVATAVESRESTPAALQEDSVTTLDMGASYTPSAAQTNDYRCFVLDPALGGDRFLSGYQVHPGDPRTVHHVILFALDSARADEAAAKKDEADPGFGYECFGGSGVAESRTIAAWAPGTRVVQYPEGTGIRLLAGRKLVMQIHYNTHHGSFPDRTRIDLQLNKTVANEALFAGVADLNLTLPAKTEDARAETAIKLAELGVPLGIFVRGVYPHMHTLGRSMHLEVEHEGTTTCVSDVPRWDFQMQRFYFFSDPLYVYPNDTLRLHCVYDTTERSSTTTFGEGTEDEMCLMGLYVTLF